VCCCAAVDSPDQAGIQYFTDRITGLEGDKAQLGAGLTKATETITCLQVSEV
jgi:hypothetical protein